MKLCVTRALRLSPEDWVVLTLWKLRVAPERFGSGTKRSSATAAGSIRSIGITLPGNGWPVRGSTIGVALAEKSPVRIAGDGTVAYWSNRLLPRLPL